eukprot:89594_1
MAEQGQEKCKVGDVVLVSGHRLAVVRFIGLVDFAEGEWIGVELKGHRDEKYGCNGSYDNRRYFKTKHEKAGLFVKNVVRIIAAEELLQKVAELNEKLLLCTCGAMGPTQNGQNNLGGDIDPNSSSEDQ